MCGALGRQGALSEEYFYSLYVRGLLTGHMEDTLKVWDSVDKPRPRCACKSGELCTICVEPECSPMEMGSELMQRC